MADTGAPLSLTLLEPDQGEADVIVNAALQAINDAIGVAIQPYDVELAAIAALVSAADRVPYFSGAGTAALATFTAAGRALAGGADASAQRTTLGVGLGDSPSLTGLSLDYSADDGNGAVLNLRKARGALGSPANVTTGQLGTQAFLGYHTGAYQYGISLSAYIDGTPTSTYVPAKILYEGYDDSGNYKTHFAVRAAGNIGVGVDSFGTSLVRGLAWASGTAPSASHPTDAIQAWVADRNATAGKASLHVRTEDGTRHVLGDLSGIGTILTGSGVTYTALNVAGTVQLVGTSSVQEREMATLIPAWATSTDASRKARAVLSVYDTAAREILRGEASGTAPMIGFLGAAAVVRQTLAATATDAATTLTLANSLRTALINVGLGV